MTTLDLPEHLAALSWADQYLSHQAWLRDTYPTWSYHHPGEAKPSRLGGANLGGANLGGANLGGANLGGAYLERANLGGANLGGAKYSPSTRWPAPTMLLLCWWGALSDELTRDCMIWDAYNHPAPERFDAWAAGGECPYGAGIQWQRACLFPERRDLWPGWARVLDGTYQCDSPINLARRLLAEKCAKEEP